MEKEYPLPRYYKRISFFLIIALLINQPSYAGIAGIRSQSGLTKAVARGLFLKLDCSNDPLQGNLDLGTNALEINNVVAFTEKATGNLFVGTNAGADLTTGDYNTYTGIYAGKDTEDGSYNTYMGYYAGYATTDGDYNVYIGAQAGRSVTDGDWNTYIGYEAGRYGDDADWNTYVGYQAGKGKSSTPTATPDKNTAMGYQAFGNSVHTSARENTMLGYQAGLAITSGDTNVLIGYMAGSQLTTESDQLYIANSNTATPLIYGDFANRDVAINADFMISNASPKEVFYDNDDGSNIAWAMHGDTADNTWGTFQFWYGTSDGTGTDFDISGTYRKPIWYADATANFYTGYDAIIGGDLTTTGTGTFDKIALTQTAHNWDDITTANDGFTLQSTYSGANANVTFWVGAPATKGMDWYLQADGGAGSWTPYLGFQAHTDALGIFAEGMIDIKTSNAIGTIEDVSDYIRFQTVSNVPEITTVGDCDLALSASKSVVVKGGLHTALTGTVTTDGTVDIVGAGTDFANGEIAVGDAIKIESDVSAGYEIFTVAAITDDTNLELDSAYAGSNDSGLAIYSDSDLFKIDNGDATNYLTVDKSGQIGIGTATPDEVLEVVGNIHLNDNDKLILGSNKEAVIYYNGSNMFFDNESGGGNFIFSRSAKVGIGVAPDENLVVQASDPAFKLKSTGAGMVSARMRVRNNVNKDADFFMYSNGWGANAIYTDGPLINNLGQFYTTGDNFLFRIAGDKPIYFSSNNKNTMYLKDESVGIGTTTPQTTLHVSGTNGITISGLGGGNDELIMQFGEAAVYNEFQILGDFAGGGATGNSLKFRSVWTDDILIMRGDGNVGIGVADPQDTLEVNGTGLFKDKLKFTQDDGNEYIDSLNDGYMDYGATTAHRFGDGTNQLLISSAGVVTLEGTAKRTLNLRPDMDFSKVTAQGKPTQVVYGAFLGYSLPLYAADEELFLSMNVPGRWDGVSDVVIHLLVALSGAEDINDDFNLQISWEHANIGEKIENTTHDVEVETNLLADRVEAYDTYQVEFILDYDVDTPDLLEAHDAMAMRLRRIAVVGTEIDGEVIVLDYHMEFQVDKMFGAPL